MVENVIPNRFWKESRVSRGAEKIRKLSRILSMRGNDFLHSFIKYILSTWGNTEMKMKSLYSSCLLSNEQER